MYIYERQFVASAIMSLCLLVYIIRQVQRGKLDIAYCWLWLGIGIGALLTVVRYDWLVGATELIGAVAPTTTLFLMAFFVVLLLCLQFSLVVSQQRRQIRRLVQELAIRSAPFPDAPTLGGDQAGAAFGTKRRLS